MKITKYLTIIIYITTKTLQISPYYTVPKNYLLHTGLPYVNECDKYNQNLILTYKMDDHFTSVGLTKYKYPAFTVDISTIGFTFGRDIYVLINGDKKFFTGRQRFYIMQYHYKPDLKIEFEVVGKGPLGRIVDLDELLIQIEISFMGLKVFANHTLKFEPVFLNVETLNLTNPVAFEKGCLEIKFKNQCSDSQQDTFFIEAPDKRFFENVSSNCEIDVDDVKKTLSCEKDFENNKLYIKGFLEHSNYNKLVICDIENPSNYNLYPFTFGTSKGKDIVKANIEKHLWAEKPMKTEIKSYSLLNSEFDLPFNSEISVNFKTHLFDKENFVISLKMPEQYKQLNKVSMTFTNLSTHSKQTFLDIEKDINFLYNIKLYKEKIDADLGIKIEVFGFKIPEVFGKMNLEFKIFDEKLKKNIVEDFIQEIKILEKDKEDFLLHLSDYNMNTKSNGILYLNLTKLDTNTFDIHFSGSTALTLEYFYDLEKITPFTYKEKKVDVDNNKLIINGINLEDDDIKYFSLKLNNLKTKFTDADNAHVRLDIFQNGKSFSNDFFFKLKKINFQIIEREIKVLENNKFEMEIDFNIDKKVDFPHFLKIKSSKKINFSNECIKETNLPYQAKTGNYHCLDVSNNLNENTILLIDQFELALIKKNYKLILSGNFDGKPSFREDVIFEIIPNLVRNDLNEFWRKKNDFSISQKENILFYLNCTDYCKECDLVNNTCLVCLDGFGLVNGNCE